MIGKDGDAALVETADSGSCARACRRKLDFLAGFAFLGGGGKSCSPPPMLGFCSAIVSYTRYFLLLLSLSQVCPESLKLQIQTVVSKTIVLGHSGLYIHLILPCSAPAASSFLVASAYRTMDAVNRSVLAAE